MKLSKAVRRLPILTISKLNLFKLNLRNGQKWQLAKHADSIPFPSEIRKCLYVCVSVRVHHAIL